MVDFYEIECSPIRDRLIHYLNERATALDYATRAQRAYNLAGTFWKSLEEHQSGIGTSNSRPRSPRTGRGASWPRTPTLAHADRRPGLLPRHSALGDPYERTSSAPRTTGALSRRCCREED